MDSTLAFVQNVTDQRPMIDPVHALLGAHLDLERKQECPTPARGSDKTHMLGFLI